MFSHVKSVGCIFSLFLRISYFALVGRLTSSESCLIEMQSVGEVSEVILISKLKPGFSVSHVKTQSQHN
ncbi:hypothetical protein VVORL1506_02939 [Vibrio vulnificus]|nr:hypothetical protein VVORL1506_02939 [Vibrio vulnificus]